MANDKTEKIKCNNCGKTESIDSAKKWFRIKTAFGGGFEIENNLPGTLSWARYPAESFNLCSVDCLHTQFTRCQHFDAKDGFCDECNSKV